MAATEIHTSVPTRTVFAASDLVMMPRFRIQKTRVAAENISNTKGGSHATGLGRLLDVAMA